MDYVGGPDLIDDVLGVADYLAVTLSLSSQTRGPDGRNADAVGEARRVPDQCRSRGNLRPGGLYETSASRRLGGAALDVWYRYPSMPGPTAPANLRFGELDNVIMTPHVAGCTEGMLDARAHVIAENIARIARGEQPINAIFGRA